MPIWLFIPLPRTEYHLLRDLILCACLWTSLLQRRRLSDSSLLHKEKPALPTATPLQSLIIMTRRENVSISLHPLCFYSGDILSADDWQARRIKGGICWSNKIETVKKFEPTLKRILCRYKKKKHSKGLRTWEKYVINTCNIPVMWCNYWQSLSGTLEEVPMSKHDTFIFMLHRCANCGTASSYITDYF